MKINEQPCASILVVEDSDEDFSALARILERQSGLRPFSLSRCIRGDDVVDHMEYLDRSLARVRKQPALIVLDLNLAGLGGREVLKRVRAHGTWRDIPVVVFSTANNPATISWCYENGANAYHVKGMNYPAFKRSAEMLAMYWLQLVQLPRTGELPLTISAPGAQFPRS